MRQIQLLFTLLLVLFTLPSFSQTGTYELSKAPKEAIRSFIDSSGVYEYPIYVGAKGTKGSANYKTPFIKLKRSKRVVIVKSDGVVVNGVWELENDRINLLLDASDGGTIAYQLVEYESGTYLESINGKRYFKKR